MTKNEAMGLPFDKMRKIMICFDVDGTLRDNTREDTVVANERIRNLLIILSSFKNVLIVVWSGSGELYARQCAKELHITQFVDGYADKIAHTQLHPDIAIDDIQDTAIGAINLIVKEK